MSLIDLAESGILPDVLVRAGIRHLLGKRLNSNAPPLSPNLSDFCEMLRESPLAVATDQANEQHYEVPADFYLKVLGPRLKYSSCFFESDSTTLAEAEEAMLSLTCERAELEDGMRILELGCGWGSLTLWMAEKYPQAQITAVSNSASQRRFIEQRAAEAGWNHVRVITADMRDFRLQEAFDRVVSVEMFEHMRNYELLFQRVANWLSPKGKALVHVFCHCETPYLFETEGASNWMGRHFFTGGMMPSENLFEQFDDALTIEQQWRVSGMHYYRTCEAWLSNLDQNRAELLRRLGEEMTPVAAKRNLQRWRMFFMACAELFRYHGGNEWFVAHYRFTPTAAALLDQRIPELHHSKPS
ncbi:SAM-dependent methyltransferase [Novipirellula artificiosorum]|uniref:Cyclopropane-fatty-acyl-phospholipid synthase n=1 Tax=Novipirellula artificiosorum TaxID=2528016 RepID=A0A5C6DXG4_9BACT|nr:cyclopropane-fatty-acyl-phospholipid synthase family protein [Novipirellula artificiosorum]TWU40914.1 Cyclopropane-fatty-acyl-phospholipid synthase [Novipirellula artificiosorum]